MFYCSQNLNAIFFVQGIKYYVPSPAVQSVSQSLIDSELCPRGGRLAQWLKSRGIAEMRDKIKYKGNKTKSNPYPNPVQQKQYKPGGF